MPIMFLSYFFCVPSLFLFSWWCFQSALHLEQRAVSICLVLIFLLFRFHIWKDANAVRGLTCPIRAKTGMQLSTKKVEAELWFGDLVSSLANIMSDVNRKELPACMTIQRVYNMYWEAMQKGGNKPLQMTQFRHMWQGHFPEVIIPKVRKVFCATGIFQRGIWLGLQLSAFSGLPEQVTKWWSFFFYRGLLFYKMQGLSAY